MNKVKKTVTSALLAVGILFGGASVANAATSGYQYFNMGDGNCRVYAWTNYNWWEETFQGKKDSYIYLYTTRC